MNKKKKELNRQCVIDLRKRFVSDLNLPIQVLQSPYFEDRIAQLEDMFQAKTKYNNLLGVIKERFNDNPDLFLKEYYNVRENIIQTLLKNEAYIEFNQSNELLSKFAIKNRQFPKKNPYTEDMVGKIMLSIDLSKANFQALNYVNREILLNSDTYADFIHKFTDLDYIVESKYTRQVVFGKLNPSRQITVEKYIMSLIYDKLSEDKDINDNMTLICLNSDELIYVVKDESVVSQGIKDKIISLVKENIGVDIKAEFFNITPIKFKQGNNATLTIFKHHNLLDGKDKLMCAPMTYFPQIICLLNGEKILDTHLVFYYEHNLAKFLKPLRLETELDIEKSSKFKKFLKRFGFLKNM